MKLREVKQHVQGHVSGGATLSPQGKPKNTGVGSLPLLQGIFLAQESNLGLLHCRHILYCLGHQGVAPIMESRSLQKVRRYMDLILL